MYHYRICDGCAAAITNCDYSAFDLDESYADALARVYAFVDAIGIDSTMTPEEDSTARGYWRCDACWSDEIGTGYVVESNAEVGA